MYEEQYEVCLKEARTSILQRLVNRSVASSTVKGYDGTGAGNAGLNVHKRDMTTSTLAVGTRWMGTFGRNVFGREAFVETRINIAQQMGNNQGKASVGFLGNSGFTQEVYGSKAGKTAIQIGAGIATPVMQNGAIFAEVNADFRSLQNSGGVSVGFRYNC